jgi:hypothetical protein
MTLTLYYVRMPALRYTTRCTLNDDEALAGASRETSLQLCQRRGGGGRKIVA